MLTSCQNYTDYSLLNCSNVALTFMICAMRKSEMKVDLPTVTT
jgi:hypothetical protein